MDGIDIELYIKRSISDIARKCHVLDIEVIKIIKKVINQ